MELSGSLYIQIVLELFNSGTTSEGTAVNPALKLIYTISILALARDVCCTISKFTTLITTSPSLHS
jgi:hypothetical protein